jgi:hypothetical protein
MPHQYEHGVLLLIEMVSNKNALKKNYIDRRGNNKRKAFHQHGLYLMQAFHYDQMHNEFCNCLQKVLEDGIGVWTIIDVFHSSLECCWVHVAEYAMGNMLK